MLNKLLKRIKSLGGNPVCMVLLLTFIYGEMYINEMYCIMSKCSFFHVHFPLVSIFSILLFYIFRLNYS
jgi:hypothetical protein